MELLHNGYTLELADGAFPLSTDSIALAGFVKLPKHARVLDLGAGCGTLGLLLCAKDVSCSVTGVERRQEDHIAAEENAQRNDLQGRLTSICADLRILPEIFPAGSFQICVSNPPYFSGGYKSQTLAEARHTEHCSPEDLFAAAAYALQYGGDFYLVHKPEMLGNLCGHAASHQLEPKRLLLLRHKENSPISLVLLQCRKGGKPGLMIEEAALHDANGNPTDYYKTLYHL